MTNNQISLDIDVISKIPFDKYTKDFLFIVDGKKYPISRFEADLLSPIIRKMHFVDESFNTFYINTNGKFSDCDFSSFLSLLNFNPCSFDQKTILYFKYLFENLGNFNESKKIQFTNPLTIDTVFEIIGQKRLFYHSNDSIEEEVNFSASHFGQLDKEALKKLDADVIDLILKSDNLKIEDEDYLLNFLIEKYSEDSDSMFLFENVNFLNVSKEEFSHFFNAFKFTDLTDELWKSVMQRALHSGNYLDFEYINGRELNGVIKYLTDEAGGNVHDKGIVVVTASSEQERHNAKFLCDFDQLGRSSMWSPNGENGATVTFDFRNKKVKLTNYTFHTPSYPTKDYPRSWLVECSNDNSSWVTLDERSNETVMNGCNVCHTYKCMSPSSEFYRYIRIRTNGPCWNMRCTRYFFDLSAVEFFGTLK